MKASCTQENLIKAISAVDKIVASNANLPILGNILFYIDQRRLKVSATNLEIGINFWIGAKIEKIGAITIPARILINFVSQLPKKRVDIEVFKNTLNIKCENHKASINGLPAKDFPIIPKIEEKEQITIRSDVLKQALSQVVSSVALDETRPEIAGVLISLSNDKIKFVGTDSYRLAEKTIKFKSEQELSFILPSRTVHEVIRILDQTEKQVKITLGENQIMFQSGWMNLVSRLTQGQYPDYEQIIPNKFKSEIIVSRSDFESVIKTTSLFAGQTSDVKLRISKTGTKAQIEVSAESSDVGKNTSFVDCAIKGVGVSLVLNSKYLLDGLKNINSEKISLKLNNSGSPVMIGPYSSAKNAEIDYLYLIMPIKA